MARAGVDEAGEGLGFDTMLFQGVYLLRTPHFGSKLCASERNHARLVRLLEALRVGDDVACEHLRMTV